MEEEGQNQNNNRNEEYINYGLLDKLQTIKEQQTSSQYIIKDSSIGLIKTSNDPEISRLCSLLMSASPSTNPIGLRLILKTISLSEKTILNLKIYEYNYLLSKKFKYLRTEAITSSNVLLIIINIYDKKCIENLQQLLEELFSKTSNQQNSNSNINYQNSSSSNTIQLNNKKIAIALLKTTDNFLMKITERQNIQSAKNDIEQMLNGNKVKFIEIDTDEISDINHIITDLIK